ncbi:hypothetical protein R6258_15565 [Halomonas sp. HP20-15]|nr:hypothetical protein [Halomonas sp. HP20-15]MDW5378342.1 hypothetical protein [Halomonas sp. HP20-15]
MSEVEVGELLPIGWGATLRLPANALKQRVSFELASALHYL